MFQHVKICEVCEESFVYRAYEIRQIDLANYHLFNLEFVAHKLDCLNEKMVELSKNVYRRNIFCKE